MTRPAQEGPQGGADNKNRFALTILATVVEPGDDFDEVHDEGWLSPLLPPEDRLWRHPSELGEHAVPVSSEALSARRSWMASTPTRAGAWSAGIVGALLATGVVLIGGHVTHLLSSTPRKVTTESITRTVKPAEVALSQSLAINLATTTTTTDTGLGRLASRVSTAMPEVFVDHKASGMGIVVSPKGYVVVPASLVADADDIGLFIDGQLIPASVVGLDAGTGLAVVHVQTSGALSSASFAKSTASETGTFAALVWTGTDGPQACWARVNHVDVQLTTSAASPPLMESLTMVDGTQGVEDGGVLVDASGRLLGMVTATTGNTLLAAPEGLVDVVAQDIISNGEVVHGWLGITGKTASLSAARTAAEVLSVSSGGAAAQAGLKAGDLIDAVDGSSVASMSQVVAKLYVMQPNESVELSVVRHGHRLDLDACLKPAA